LTAATSASLCASCVWTREVSGRHEQIYLLCRNNAIPEKYPRQPVISCAGYKPNPQTDWTRA